MYHATILRRYTTAYITADTLRQAYYNRYLYYGRHRTANILRQAYYNRYLYYSRYSTADMQEYYNRYLYYGRYSTADIVQQMYIYIYYGLQHVTAGILGQIYYDTHITADTVLKTCGSTVPISTNKYSKLNKQIQ